MQIGGEHPAARYESEVRTAQRRAVLAAVLLVLMEASRVISVPALLWQLELIRQMLDDQAWSLSFFLSLAGARLLLLLATGVCFLRWVHKVTALTRALGGETLRWTPRQAVLGFIIPFLNFVRPYQVMRDLHAHLAPDAVPAPPMQVRADETTGYRQVELKAPPPPKRLPHAFVGAWWGCFVAGKILVDIAPLSHRLGYPATAARSPLFSLAALLEIAATVFTVLMVRAVTARLQERFRRLRHTPVEALQAAGITVA
jgi:hypothetical protein